MASKRFVRNLTGGINADLSPEKTGKGELLNSLNMRPIAGISASSGALQLVGGNTAVATANNTGTSTLIGKWVNQAKACIYMAFYAPAADSCIVEYNTITGVARRVIDDSMVTGGLGFSATDFVSMDGTGDFVFWTNNQTDVRYVNTTRNYAGTVASDISLITEPGMVPAVSVRVNTPSASSTIQTVAAQFTYRIANLDGFTSVLAPYSLTSLPTRKSAIVSSASAGNTITASIPITQKIPVFWETVDMVVRFPSDNSFYVIRTWSVTNPADVAAVAAHNAGSTPLTITAWDGTRMEELPQSYTEKTSDSIPPLARCLALANNRIFLGGITDGYTTPAIVPILTLTPTNFTATAPTTFATTPAFIVIVQQKDTRNWYFAVIFRISGVNYLLPKDMNFGKFFHDANTLAQGVSSYFSEAITNGLFNLPVSVSNESLIVMKEQGDPDISQLGYYNPGLSPGTAQIARNNIVIEANDLTGFTPEDAGGNLNQYLAAFYDPAGATYNVLVENTPSEFGPASESRAFAPVPYYYGLDYYDSASRKCGRVNVGSFTPISYTVNTPSYRQLTNITVPSGVQAGIPDFATSYAVTLSRAGRAISLGMFFGGIVKALFKNGANEISYRDPTDLTSVPSGFTIYGVGVPIPDTYNYAFVAGDYVEYSVGNSAGRAAILGTYNGHIVIQFTNDGVMHTLCDGWSKRLSFYNDVTGNVRNAFLTATTIYQKKTAFFLFSGIGNENEQYELAAFGPISGAAGSKTFGNFYSSSALNINIFGDTYTQKRVSAGGGGVGVAMSTYDDAASIFWVNDLGRITPTDTIGQKVLDSTVRFGNSYIPGAEINGIASFDAGDYKNVETTAGAITSLAPTTRGAQDGGQLVVICQRGSFVGQVGQTQVKSSDGTNAVTISGVVLSDFMPLVGGWGCVSPRSVAIYEGSVWWWDAYRAEIVEFNSSGAESVSRHGMIRVFRQLAVAMTDPSRVSAAVNPYTQEVMFSFPGVPGTKGILPSTSVPTPDDAFYPGSYTYSYNWAANKWWEVYQSGAEMMAVGEDVYSYLLGMWKEFTDDIYLYGGPYAALVALPFNEAYSATLRPLTIEIDADRAPDLAYVICRDATTGLCVAPLSSWKQREGMWQGIVYRNRLSPGATAPTWDNLGLTGDKIKTRCPIVILIYNGGSVLLRSIAINVADSPGHLK